MEEVKVPQRAHAPPPRACRPSRQRSACAHHVRGLTSSMCTATRAQHSPHMRAALAPPRQSTRTFTFDFIATAAMRSGRRTRAVVVTADLAAISSRAVRQGERAAAALRVPPALLTVPAVPPVWRPRGLPFRAVPVAPPPASASPPRPVSRPSCSVVHAQPPTIVLEVAAAGPGPPERGDGDRRMDEQAYSVIPVQPRFTGQRLGVDHRYRPALDVGAASTARGWSARHR